MSLEKVSAIFSTPKPGFVGFPENPNPGKEGVTT